jgi:outer membrane protein
MTGQATRGKSRGTRVRRWGLLAGALLALAAGPAGAQEPMTLTEALSTASDGAYAVRIAEGEARERSSGRLEALQGILPTVRIESGFMRTTDPVATFGVQLRQRTITAADFDPARLNRPPVGENWTGAVVLEVPLLNPDAWLGLGAADRAGDAAELAAEWEGYETRGDVVRAYYGAILAADKVSTLEAAVKAARAHVRQAELMVEQGVVTKSDALLARVKAGEVEAELASARGEARSAVRQLATLLGRPGELPALPYRLPPAEAVRRVVGAGPGAASTDTGPAGPTSRADGRGLLATAPAGAVEERLDVRAARLGLSAARRDLLRARSTWLPRINAFGRWDWHSPDGVYEGDENWTVGVMAQWTPVAGASHLAETRGAAGRRAVAEARAEAARANARLEAETTADRLEAALERLTIAERAVEHATEAHRIVSRKYDGGLATVVELLDASATETRTRLERAHAVYSVIAEGAARALALGRDPARFATLDDYAHDNPSE